MNTNFVLLSLLLLLIAPLTIGQNSTAPEAADEEDLESMSDQELEFICIERGFELIRSESEGELTHADYVDAAKRCLAIEEDMNEILEQNPELAEELLSEVDRLKAEKERMEQERQRMLAEKEKLEEQIEQQNQKQQYARDNESSPRMWGAQAETSGKSNNNVSEANAGKGTTAFASRKSSTDAGSSVDKGPSASSTSLDTENTDDDIPIDDYDYVHEEEEEVNGTTLSEAEECATNETSTEDSPSSTEASKTDENTQFSLTGFIQEVVAEFEKDVRLITRLVYPVVKPLLGAKDFAWKYLRSIFEGAKRHAELFQQNKSKGQGEGNQQDGGSADLTNQKQTS